MTKEFTFITNLITKELHQLIELTDQSMPISLDTITTLASQKVASNLPCIKTSMLPDLELYFPA